MLTLWDLMQAGGDENDLYIIQIDSLKTAQISPQCHALAVPDPHGDEEDVAWPSMSSASTSSRPVVQEVDVHSWLFLGQVCVLPGVEVVQQGRWLRRRAGSRQ
jgi:hypothetical protein